MKTVRIDSQTFLKVAFSIFLLTYLLSCNKNDGNDNPENNLLAIENEYTINNDIMESYFGDLPNSTEVYDYADLFYELRDLSDSMSSQHTFSKVHYSSTDNKGNSVTLSGLLIYPSHGIKSNTPLISHNHGTEMEKKLAPSGYVPGQSDILKYPEVMIAWSMSAMNDWVIIMPDYQGMGDDTTEVHPYCIKDRLAVSTADMVEAAQKTMVEKFNKNWNGNTYVMGYSEGGYVTMAALQELEKRNTDLSGALCMEGPYDLSGAMLDIMLKDTAFPVPYFLPYMLVGYNDQYPDYFNFDDMLINPYNVDIPKYATGFYSSDKVNNIMPSDHILKEVFTESFVDTLSLSTSRAHQYLYHNNAYIGWTPSTDMLLWHCKNDDCVPFANYEKVKSTFGSLPNVTYKEYPPIKPIFSTIHQTAAPIAFMQGAIWIMEHEKDQ